MKAKLLRALFALMLLSPSLAIYAADADESPRQALVLKFADATTANFFLADKPTIGFADGKLTVTATELTADYEQASVAEFYFDTITPTAIAGVKGAFGFAYTDGVVRVSGSKASVATLYTADGTLVESRGVVDGAVEVSLVGCKPGVYVLNLENEHSFKIVRK